jgi:hypothetical protein
MRRVRDVDDLDRALAAAADVCAAVGQREARVQAAGAQVVMADLFEGRWQGRRRRGDRLKQREQRDGDQRRGSRQAQARLPPRTAAATA